MAVVKFPFEKSSSAIFGSVWRPIAKVGLWSRKLNDWLEVIMIVDTGADYTILPRFYAIDLGISIHKDCETFAAFGIGGSEKVYLSKNARVKIGKWERYVPVGFLDRDDIPPLLGRQEFLETFKIILDHHSTSFCSR